MLLYRICNKKYQQSAFDGEGAKQYGGRWNNKGIATVYLSNSPALAVLEILVHLNDQSQLRNFCLFEINVPEAKIVSLPQKVLSSNWRVSTNMNETRRIGDHWLTQENSLCLQVPSTIINAPNSFNFFAKFK